MTLTPINQIYAHATLGQPKPVPGMGVTVLYWSDRYPATVLAYITNILIVQEDTAKCIVGGQTENQVYEFTPNTAGRKWAFKFDEKKGRWREMEFNSRSARWKLAGSGISLILGARDKYIDPSF